MKPKTSKNTPKTPNRVRSSELVKRHFKRCNWMLQSKGWKDCGCKATWHARGIGSYYCTKHRSHVSGWRYDLVPLNDQAQARPEQPKG
jgi:hypothetical protein